MGKGAEKKKKWKINKRLQGWTWSQIDGHRSRSGGSSYEVVEKSPLLKFFETPHIDHKSPDPYTYTEIMKRLDSQAAEDNLMVDELIASKKEIEIEDEDAFLGHIDVERITQEVDNRRKRLAVTRDGRTKFRNAAMERYGRKCVITGETTEEVLEAAHIKSYRGKYCNNPS
jgi:hypothetical protein